ncbi:MULTISPECIES: transposase [Streptomyces]|uniref:transposase n=1 Tax=Streptomyces TaxID=1883 RepID=UPI000AC24F8F|nr:MULTISPECIES: transposase [Streptomyces]
MPAALRQVVGNLLETIDAVQQVVDRVDAVLVEAAKTDPRVKTLTALPGVGVLTGLIILAEVGDISRFPSARKPVSWAGLTPTVCGSDRTVRYGHISKQGDPWPRWIMCEAAQRAKRSPVHADASARIARRRGKKFAATAIARKLLTHAYHLLREAADAQEPREADTPT